MNFLKTQGDDLLTFLGLASVTLSTAGLLDPNAMKWATIVSLLSAVAHKVFFPQGAGK